MAIPQDNASQDGWPVGRLEEGLASLSSLNEGERVIVKAIRESRRTEQCQLADSIHECNGLKTELYGWNAQIRSLKIALQESNVENAHVVLEKLAHDERVDELKTQIENQNIEEREYRQRGAQGIDNGDGNRNDAAGVEEG